MLRSLLLSTASNGARFVVATVITLVMTPVYIQQLGNYDYGIWEILGSVVGYLGLIDLGLRPTISRFAAYFSRRDDGGDQISLFATSVGLMAGVGIIISLSLLAWSLTFPNILAPGEGSSGRYAFVIQLFALHVLGSFPYYALESIFEGRLWYPTKNNIAITHQVLSASFLYFYLPHYDPLVLMIATNLVSTLSKLVVLLGLLHFPRYGGYRLKPSRFDLALVVRMIRFGSKSMAQGIAGKISKRADSVLIGVFLGPQNIVFFNLAHMLIQRVGSLTQIISHAFMPAFSTMHAANDQAGMERYFFAGTKYVYALQAGASLGLIVVGDAFISLWVGPEYGEAAAPLIWILALGMLLAGSLPLHNRLLTALDRHGRLAALYSGRAVLNVGLTLILIRPYGLLGVALATLGAQLVFTPMIWCAVFTQLQARPWDYLRNNVVPILACAVLMAGATAGTASLTGIGSWGTWLAAVVTGMVVYSLLLSLIVLDDEDRAFLHQVWQKRPGGGA